jgi:hypothetical protein
MRRVLGDGFLLFGLAFIVFELSVNDRWATDHATSFAQLAYALLTSHSVALGRASSVPPWTVDDFRYAGQNYSALAPGTAFLALPFMAVAFAAAGGYTAYGPTLLLSETFVSVTAAASAYLVFKIGGLFFRRATSVLLGVAFAFSTICWPLATYFFQSDVSALFVLAAAYFALRGGRAGGRAWGFALVCGLMAGVAFTVDYVNAVALLILLGFLVAWKRGSARAMAASAGALVVGALPGVAVVGAYNFAIFGTPFMSTESAYLGHSLLGEFSTPLPYGLALNLVSLSRGLFVFAPFTLLGVLGLVDGLRVSSRRSEVLFLLALFLGVLIPYSTWYDPTGGLSFGPRFLVAGMPFLIVPAGFVVEGAKRWKMALVYAVYAAGAVVNGVAAFVTAVPPQTPFDVSPFTSYILPNFFAGNLDSVWATYLGGSWVVGGALVLSLGVALPLAWVEAVRRKEPTRLGAEERGPHPEIQIKGRFDRQANEEPLSPTVRP